MILRHISFILKGRKIRPKFNTGNGWDTVVNGNFGKLGYMAEFNLHLLIMVYTINYS